MGDNGLNTSVPNSDDHNDDNNDAITMVDVLEQQTELEEDANAVLGACDAKNCTYPEGYVKRQALYACLTCLPENGDDSKFAGVCLACSYFCHEKHNLVELYTKRNFRCDCGNGLFGDKKCVLQEDKENVNEKNKYNQNFRGTYCTCARPYPDMEDDVADSMIQCIICEDWYHCRHLGSPVPAHDEYGEMICKSCMTQHKFLQKYSGLCVTKVTGDKSESTAPVVVHSPGTTGEKLATSEVKPNDLASDTPTKLNDSVSEPKDEPSGNDQSAVVSNGSADKSFASEDKPTNKHDECSFAKMKDVETPVEGATFWSDNWRNHLCTCSGCKAMYIEEGVEFLLDQQDTVHAYEERGKTQGEGASQYDQAMDALQQMDRVNQIEAILGYNDMKESLKEYLRDFAERKKVVRKEDIDEFFNLMQARKRQRVELPHNCR